MCGACSVSVYVSVCLSVRLSVCLSAYSVVYRMHMHIHGVCNESDCINVCVGIHNAY